MCHFRVPLVPMVLLTPVMEMRDNIKDVLYVLKLHVKLLLVSKLVSNNWKVQFNLNECIVKSLYSESIVIAPRQDNLYNMNIMNVHKMDAVRLVQYLMEHDAFKLWHRCLEHLNVKGFYVLQKMVSDVNFNYVFCLICLLLCKACINDKQHKVVFLNHWGRLLTKPLKIMYSNIYGPMRTTSTSGAI